MTGLDLIGTIVLTGVVVVNVTALAGAVAETTVGRIAIGAGTGAWLGLQIGLVSAGAYAGPIPYVGLSLAAPLIVAAIAWSLSARFRTRMLTLPAWLPVALNASRVLGVFFLILAAEGRLGGPFPQFAGWGDIITGIVALPLAIALMRGTAGRRSVLGWNAFGALDLIVAVSLGVVSGSGSPVQLIDAGAGSAAIGNLPWSLIPTVLVPFYLFMHWVIYAQVREGSWRAATA